MAELAAAATADERAEEAGDLLFAAVNLVRAYGIAPEDALRAANAKFERRFRAMEALAKRKGETSPLCRSMSRKRCGSRSKRQSADEPA